MGYLAIIPARSGSKGLKDKNIKDLNGHPLIYYSIKAAIDSGCFDEIHVSTDSQTYQQIAINCGANVPFLRNPETSLDTSSTWDTVKECLNKYSNLGKTFDGFMLLQPTSPLRTAEDIKKAFKIYQEKQANIVVSVVKEEYSPLQSFMISESSEIKDLAKNKYFECRRQDLPDYYKFNGAIYLLNTQYFYNNFNSIYKEGVYACEMPSNRSIDIDNSFDFFLAEQILKYKKETPLL